MSCLHVHDFFTLCFYQIRHSQWCQIKDSPVNGMAYILKMIITKILLMGQKTRKMTISPHVDPHHFVKVFQWSGFNTSFENYTSIVDLFIGGNILSL